MAICTHAKTTRLYPCMTNTHTHTHTHTHTLTHAHTHIFTHIHTYPHVSIQISDVVAALEQAETDRAELEATLAVREAKLATLTAELTTLRGESDVGRITRPDSGAGASTGSTATHTASGDVEGVARLSSSIREGDDRGDRDSFVKSRLDSTERERDRLRDELARLVTLPIDLA